MATTMRRTNRTASPARWQAALARAIAEGVQVRQLAGCGAWIATSGHDATVAYQVAVSGGVAHGCDCPAGEHGDPVCKHRALWYHLAGLLDPEPEPPAPAVAAIVARPCAACDGEGVQRIITGGRLSDWWAAPCHACASTGTVPVLAMPRTCGWCGGSGWVDDPDCRQAPEPCECPRHRDRDNDPTEADVAAALADADAAYAEYQAMRDAEFDERERQVAWEADRARWEAVRDRQMWERVAAGAEPF